MGRSRKKAFEEVKAKVLGKVAGWKVRTLSQAGRATLIKSVAASMPIYCMLTFLLPKGWCAEIDRILKDFCGAFLLKSLEIILLRRGIVFVYPKSSVAWRQEDV